MATMIDLDDYYTKVSIPEWQAILGPGLHYHYGYFEADEDVETGAQRTVQNFYPWIPKSAKVLDAGCGWGGPAMLLSNERNCDVHGITVSRGQAKYCSELGLNVSCENLEEADLSGQYDVAMCLGAFEHISDKPALLEKFSRTAPTLVLSVTCRREDISPEKVNSFPLTFCSPNELRQMLTDSGWHIVHFQDNRFFSIRTLEFWKKNLDTHYPNVTAPGQLADLQKVTNTAFSSLSRWCSSFPMLDIVAIRK